ncbi:MAG: CocE/NonD family hydrolase, partial [Solirubrobacteraceae bacterium]
YPDGASAPGPQIGFGQECLRWWDQWLRGRETGVMDEPVLRAWMQEPVAPAPFHAIRPGRWVAEDAWPAPAIGGMRLALGNRTLGAGGAAGASASEPDAAELCLTVSSPQTCGIDAGAWCAHGGPADAPPDQRADDGRALCFTSEPLPERIELLGAPELTLEVAADRPVALVAARLCDVAPDGASSLITRGVLNISHRDGHAVPEPLEPGRRYRVRLALDAIGQAVAAGHRLRLAISSTYWPWVWPSPERVTLSVFPAGSALALPVRAPRDRDGELAEFASPEGAAPLEVEVLRPAPGGMEVHRDVSTGEVEIVARTDEGGLQRLVESGLEMELTCTTRYRILDDDPLSARVSCTATSALGRGPWRTRVDVHSVMDCDASTFRVTTEIDAYEGDGRVLARRETFTTPRRLV